MDKLKRIMLFCTIFTYSQIALAVESIESISEFEEEISRDMAIAHFYTKNGEVDPLYVTTTNTFEDVDNLHRFVRFIKINISREQLSVLAKDFKIEKTPLFILFSRGREIARLELDPSQISISKIQDFIFKHFNEEIEKREEQWRREEAIREEVRREIWQQYPYYRHYYYDSYYYPWYGSYGYPYGYYYGKPGFYFQFSTPRSFDRAQDRHHRRHRHDGRHHRRHKK